MPSARGNVPGILAKTVSICSENISDEAESKWQSDETVLFEWIIECTKKLAFFAQHFCPVSTLGIKCCQKTGCLGKYALHPPMLLCSRYF